MIFIVAGLGILWETCLKLFKSFEILIYLSLSIKHTYTTGQKTSHF